MRLYRGRERSLTRAGPRAADEETKGKPVMTSLLLKSVLSQSCCSLTQPFLILLLAVTLITLESNTFYRCCRSESCNKTYRSFISIVLALLGIAFSGYNCIISALGLIQGPFCNSSTGWDYIFKDTAGGYLTDYSAWSRCTEPARIVEWNTILLSILIALSGLQMIICFLKVAAELKRTLCGTYSVFVQD
ncbi:transmembrane 4 L6 family member 18 isoform X4 [Struthio camelus]|uniref:transmembrane 4 L6 family member 18 isoform X4 n=1 Tax=Struthio camelus TaxID=8801 RepID=UPI003603FA4F